MMPVSTMYPEIDGSSGGCLVDTSGRVLPLEGARLTADAAGGVARVILAQRFRNPHAEPLVAKYTFPLPAGAAVSGFSFVVGGRRMVGQVEGRAAARATFERALVEGRGAALLDQERTSLFTQELGNLPPGGEVVVEIILDQPLAWLDEGAWEWRFPMAAAPRYLGGPGRVADASQVFLQVAASPLPVAFTLDLRVRDALSTGRAPESPSHPLAARTDAAGTWVALADSRGAPLDRDVVVRWPVARADVGVSLDLARPAAGAPHADAAYGLLTLVPPDASARRGALRRDVILLLDTSGSMGGEPLRQAQRVASALVDTLGPRDTLEMIEFSNAPRSFRAAAVHVGHAERRDALAWIASLRASGGTEMREGILEALRPRRDDAQRQIVLVTDGLIGFEDQIVAAVLSRLPPGSRVHTVGVGSSVNRSLTAPVARAGRGVEVVLGIGEDPERAARRIVARTDVPIVVDLEVLGSAVLESAPSHAPDLFARAPALLALKLRPEGGEIVVRGRTDHGVYEQRVAVAPVAHGVGTGAIPALFARETVEDLETLVASGGDRAALDAGIERVGVTFQIATRLTSWVATTAEAIVDPRAGTRREQIPQALPHGMSVEGLGLRTAVASAGDMLPDMAEDEVRTISVERLASPAFAPRSLRQKAEKPTLPPAAAPLARPLPGPARPAPVPPASYGQPPPPPQGQPGAPPPPRAVPPAPASPQPKAKDEPAARREAPPPMAGRAAPASTVARIRSSGVGSMGPEIGDPILVVTHARDPSWIGRRYDLRGAALTIGRTRDAEIHLPEPLVARRHARLERDESGFVLVDLGSTNGVRIGGARVTRERLVHGVQFRVGGTLFKYLEGPDVESQYRDEIYRLTVFDGLTDVHSARFVRETLEREVSRARVSHDPLVLVLVGLDGAASWADRYGRDALEEALVGVARAAAPYARGDELLGRFGDDVFALVLPRASIDAALTLASRLRDDVARAGLAAEGGTERASVSAGIAALAPDDTEQTLGERALRALAEARAAGRAQIVVGGA